MCSSTDGKEVKKVIQVQPDKVIFKKGFKSIAVELETEKGNRKYLIRRTSKGKLILV
jgi:hypothetical protein